MEYMGKPGRFQKSKKIWCFSARNPAFPQGLCVGRTIKLFSQGWTWDDFEDTAVAWKLAWSDHR
jgi:hypothetical protein